MLKVTKFLKTLIITLNEKSFIFIKGDFVRFDEKNKSFNNF